MNLREMEEELIVNLKKSEFLVAMATDPEDPTKVNIPYLKNKQGDILQPAFTDVMEFDKFARGKKLRAAAQETKASEGEVKAEEAPAAETPVQ